MWGELSWGEFSLGRVVLWRVVFGASCPGPKPSALPIVDLWRDHFLVENGIGRTTVWFIMVFDIFCRVIFSADLLYL